MSPEHRCRAPAHPGAEGSEARPGSPSSGPVRAAPGKRSHKALECLSPQTELDLWGPLVPLLHFDAKTQLGHHSGRTGRASGTWGRAYAPAWRRRWLGTSPLSQPRATGDEKGMAALHLTPGSSLQGPLVHGLSDPEFQGHPAHGQV